MRIYEMTATFGKLNQQTLSLKPGLNIIEAPNEWGKSTWCAFLLAMFYGMDTRLKTTKTVLADKEHYVPWSGQPMSGRVRLQWGGRDITIERSTRGRVPMGTFAAYETETGLAVSELNGENCGEMLLGAEKSVFARAGFVRLSDLPVTRDDSLSRRLNALVTTGDESGDGDRLARELKNLKNKCRYNKSGLLPQTEASLKEVRKSLGELKDLEEESEKLTRQAQDLEEQLAQYENHLTHLSNREASRDAARVREARKQKEEAEEKVKVLQNICEKLPSLDQLLKKQEKVQNYSKELDALLEEERMLPRIDPPPAAPAVFAGMVPREAVEMAELDQKAYEKLQLNFFIVFILAAICCGAAAVTFFALQHWVLGTISILAGAGLIAGGFVYQKLRKEKMQVLVRKYGDDNPDNWSLSARFYLKASASYEKDAGRERQQRIELNDRLEKLRQQQSGICGSRTVSETAEKLQKMIGYRQSLIQAVKDQQQTENHLNALMAMAKKSQKTELSDALYCSEEETLDKIRELQTRQQNLGNQIGQCQGRMEALGTEAQLLNRRDSLQEKIKRLEDFYEALTIAQENLQAAAQELQRRFAPKITRRAQELMQKMTGGRYEKLTMEEDFSLNTRAGEEPVQHSALWRSEGTVDQLYLSLRLAVSEALMPEAPLVLDDALVRFDQQRLKKALEILEDESKQVILFTCQAREGQLLPHAVIKHG